MTIGEEIRKRREALNIPVKKLVLLTGISRHTIRDIEAGRQTDPKLSTITRLLDALDCDLAIMRRLP